MIVHQLFAQIFENEVKNIIVCDNYELANWLSRATYGDSAYAVDCLQYPCAPGDRYHDRTFYRINRDTGEEFKLEYIPTQEQQIQQLNREKEELMIVMADMIGGVYSA